LAFLASLLVHLIELVEKFGYAYQGQALVQHQIVGDLHQYALIV